MIKTTDIRPEDAQRRYQEMFAEQRAAYQDDQGNLRPEFTVDCECPVCGSADRTPFDQPSPYQTCQSCSCVYASPRLKDEVISDLAGNSPALQFFHEHILLATSRTRREQVFSSSLDLIRQNVPESGKVLELGCAVGTFLDMLRDAGFKAEGNELCRFSIDHTRSEGHTIHDKPVEQLNLPENTFDAACAWGVFGHLTKLRETVATLQRLLKPGGFLAFTATNIASFEYMLLKSQIMNPFLRYVYYTPQCVERLLSEAGFRDITITTPGETDVQTVRETLGQPTDILDAFHNDLLFSESRDVESRRESYQKWLSANLRSGYMLITARAK